MCIADGNYTTVQKPMVLPPSKAELRRLHEHPITPDVRYHYRVIAARHALKAARLMEDNTEELADVLDTAGLWVKERDEKLADRIYSLIEKRCPQTQLGKAVLARHWFVDEKGPWRMAQETAHQALRKNLGLPEE